MRKYFDSYLCEIAKTKKCYLIHCDLWGFKEFSTMYPENVINLGLAENMVVPFADGLAQNDSIVFVYDIANFILARNIENLRLLKNKVIFISGAAGFPYYTVGDGHYLTNDIALARAVDMEIFAPVDNNMLVYAVQYAINSEKSTYIRLGLDNCTEKVQETESQEKVIFTYGWLYHYLKKNIGQNYNIIALNKLSADKINNTVQQLGVKKYFIVEDHIHFGSVSSLCAFKHTAINFGVKSKFGVGSDIESVLKKANLHYTQILEILEK